jgi:GNAT superfamily N-acetyltransferase
MPSELDKFVTNCAFSTKEKLKDALRELLGKYGDDLPAEAIEQAVSDENLGNWVTYCDSRKPDELVAGFHYEHNDWYLCTLKNAAVKTEARGKGIGRQLYLDTASKAKADPRCLVLAADVTYDNEPSIRALKRAGFEEVNMFCWGKGQKPANIMHMILHPPTGTKCE